MPRVLFRAVAALVLITSIGVLGYFARNSRAAAAAPDQAKHGLTGYYYVSAHETQNDTPPAGSFVQAWHSPNDFHLPRVAQNLQTPAAVRVDPQVAFGKGKGFVPENGQQSVWWPANYPVPASWSSYLASIYIPDAKPWEYLAAVIWKGHIHLPKAGTYYFATVSNWTSAVYVNQARVALSGAGVMVSDAFSYAKEDIQDFAINLRQASSMEGWAPRPCPEACYVIPVTIDGPRDLPIEVRLSAFVTNKNGLVNAFHTGSAWGIDLFWVTPDSPRDANGKPIAQIVPSDALYTEVPSQMEKPIVRSANSTLSADFMYFPGQSAGSYVTVSVRLADKDGNPVAGKRVHVTSLVTAGSPDSIVQPEKPTDENGVTTAKVLPAGGYGHDSTIFATDLTDFVDISQVAHVTFQSEANTSFFPDAFSPYYDGGKIFTVEPLPLMVGRPVTIKVHLQNHTRVPHELTATFLAQGANIGGPNWQEIGKAEGIRLMPGENKEASITWTPQKESGHVCFRIDLSGHPIAAYQPDTSALSAALLPLAVADQGSQDVTESRQRNIAEVEQDNTQCHNYSPLEYNAIGVFNPVLYSSGYAADYAAKADELQKEAEEAAKLGYKNKSGDLRFEAQAYRDVAACARYGDASRGIGATKAAAKFAATARLKGLEEKEKEEFHDYVQCLSNLGHWLQEYCDAALLEYPRIREDIIALKKVIEDPPDVNYRRLAVSASEAPSAYLTALLVSMERYQGAQAAGDTEWVARHVTAMRLYEKRLAGALRLQSGELEQKAQSLPPDNPENLTARQAELEKHWPETIQGDVILPDQRQKLVAKGLTEAEVNDMVQRFRSLKQPPKLKEPRAVLLELAETQKASADQWQQVSEIPMSGGTEGQTSASLSQTYTVANPHDKQETVDLSIRPISIPPDWKLSIMNAEQPAASDQKPQGQKAPGDNPPKYPVQEVEAGKHYAVTLPAKAQVKVASVLVPVGEIGARTTARWAVEGRIGNELIGGMVHEMKVPYIIADLQLPPVGSKEIEEELPAPSKNWMPIAAEIAAGIVVVGLLAYFFLLWRRRRQAHTV